MPKYSALQEFLHKLELSFYEFYVDSTARLLPGVFYARNPEPVNLSGKRIRMCFRSDLVWNAVVTTSLMQNEQDGQ